MAAPARTLGRTGLAVSPLGFGGIPIQRVPAAEAARAVEAAVRRGIRLFDTARAYGDSEEKLGRALAGAPGAILATKSMARTRAAMAADVEKSLAALRVRTVDLYQVHSVNDEATLARVLGPGGALEALLDARARGLVRHVGVTGHVPRVLERAVATGLFDAVQFPVNAVETEALVRLLPLARRVGAGTIAMKPLAGGALRRPGPALRFVLETGVDVALAGMATVAEVEENAAAVAAAPAPGEAEALRAEAAALGETFCRRCGYCLPCPEGLDVPLLLLLDGYSARYGLAGWAKAIHARQERGAGACTECGECEERCPYGLPVRSLLRDARARLG